MSFQNLSPYNTRLFKLADGGETTFELRLASVAGAGESFPICIFKVSE